MINDFMKKIGVIILIGLISGPALAAGNISKGKKVFNKCKACHSLVEGKRKMGPSLYGIFDKKAGTTKKFRFSSEMKNSGIVWNSETLSRYLASPKTFMPGNKMPFSDIKNQTKRDDLIAYLKKFTK